MFITNPFGDCKTMCFVQFKLMLSDTTFLCCLYLTTDKLMNSVVTLKQKKNKQTNEKVPDKKKIGEDGTEYLPCLYPCITDYMSRLRSSNLPCVIDAVMILTRKRAASPSKSFIFQD